MKKNRSKMLQRTGKKLVIRTEKRRERMKRKDEEGGRVGRGGGKSRKMEVRRYEEVKK